MPTIEEKLAALDAQRGPLYRTQALCAWCGAVGDREECTHCGNDPEGPREPCPRCGGSGRFAFYRQIRCSDESPDDAMLCDEECFKCGGSGEIEGEWAEDARLWADGYELALADPARARQHWLPAEGDYHARGRFAALVYLESLANRQRWDAQTEEWRREMAGTCDTCGLFMGARLSEQPCGCCAAWGSTKPTVLRIGERFQLVEGVRSDGSPLWRRFDAGGLRAIDPRFFEDRALPSGFEPPKIEAPLDGLTAQQYLARLDAQADEGGVAPLEVE